MRRIILIGGAILLCLFVLFGAQKRAEAPSLSNKVERTSPTLSIGQATISVELATTETERVLGLGGREALAPNAGMLFVFPRSDFQGIWMKGMRFPLDIIWLTDEQSGTERGETRLRVVDMKKDIAPATFPKIFFPEKKASYVLEMNAGAATKNEITLGSVLMLKK